jgi:hypothetical protein
MYLIEPQREQNQLARRARMLCRMAVKGQTRATDIGIAFGVPRDRQAVRP